MPEIEPSSQRFKIMFNKIPQRLFRGYFLAALSLTFLFASANFSQTIYFPAEGDNWEQRAPERVKIDAGKLKEAIDFAVASESKAPRNLELAHYQTFGR